MASPPQWSGSNPWQPPTLNDVPRARGPLGERTAVLVALAIAVVVMLAVGLVGVLVVRGRGTGSAAAAAATPPAAASAPSTPVAATPAAATSAALRTPAASSWPVSRNAAGAELDRLPLAAADQVRSVTSAHSIIVTFVNRSTRPVVVQWINGDGRPVTYQRLGAGLEYDQQTFTTHPWLVTRQDGTPLVLVIAGDEPGTVTVRVS